MVRAAGVFILSRVPTVLTFAGLAGVAAWGVSTGWRATSPFAPAAEAGADPGDEEPPIRVTPGPPALPGRPPAAVKATITFASAGGVARSGFGFAEAEAKPLTRYVEATAVVAYDPASYYQLSTRAAGTIVWVEKVPGQAVAKGEVLALVDAAEVGRLKSDLVNGLTQLELARQTLQRLDEGAVAGNVSERSVREGRAAVDSAVTKLQSDRQALLNVGLPVDTDELGRLPAAERFGRVRVLGLPAAALAAARGRGLDGSAGLVPVVSPLAGVVVRRTAAPGDTVAANKPLFAVAAVGRVHIELAVEPRDADLLRPGQEVLFAPESAPGDEARATLAHVVPEVDETTRKVSAHAEADNPGGRLRPNAYGRARVAVATDPGAVVVPESAVQRDGADSLVFVRVADAAFEARRVTPGLRAGGLVAVDAVRPGEGVVTTGSHVLLAELRRDQLGGGD